MQALTVGDGAHLVLVSFQWRYVLVLIASVVHIAGNNLPTVLTAAFIATIYLEVVHYTVCLPCQHHAALSGLCHQRIVYLAIAFMIEVWQVRLLGVGIDSIRISEMSSNWYKHAANLCPTIAKLILNAIKRLINKKRVVRCRFWNGISFNHFPVAVTQVAYHRFY